MREVGSTSNRRRAWLAIQAVAAAVALDPADVLAPTRGTAKVALGRQVAMYISHVAFGLPIGQVAKAFKRDRTTVAHACRVIEEHREERRFDAWLRELEYALRAVPFTDAPDLWVEWTDEGPKLVAPRPAVSPVAAEVARPTPVEEMAL